MNDKLFFICKNKNNNFWKFAKFIMMTRAVWLNPGRQNPDGSKKQPAQAGLYPGGVKIQPGKN